MSNAPFGPDRQVPFWIFAIALPVAVFLVYQPALTGGLVWDDDRHVTPEYLQSWDGLCHIWSQVRARSQYYPVIHTAFWIEHGLWGDAPLGYHLVNIALHSLAALLAARVLLRLGVPGAYLAAALFALHPVQVESVAWITEQKNTLSGVFYFAAALVYLEFDRTRKPAWYLAAAGLFLLALASKTVTATLPGALLVVFWWRRGRLSWTKDVLPLVPFFVVGAGMGMLTAWFELDVNQCAGPEFDFTRLQRVLIAGRAVWFHLATLVWPADLTFIYPRWQVDPHAWRQWLYPAGAAAVVAAAWAVRRRTRAPLAAVLYFGGTLFPTLGFFNLYTFRYSLVANHYQYLACLGMFALAAAGADLAIGRATRGVRIAGQAAGAALLAVLALLSWRQSQDYADYPTLLLATVRKNPDNWMVQHNLGRELVRAGRCDEALVHLRKAMALRPDADAHYYLGVALSRSGKAGEAIDEYRKAVELDPDHADAHGNLGALLARAGQPREALVHFRRAVEIKPDDAKAHANLGGLLASRGFLGEALEQFQMAFDLATARHDKTTADFARARIDRLQWSIQRGAAGR
jgi:tetratricopeptide (TPR) repeat protein